MKRRRLKLRKKHLKEIQTIQDLERIYNIDLDKVVIKGNQDTIISILHKVQDYYAEIIPNRVVSRAIANLNFSEASFIIQNKIRRKTLIVEDKIKHEVK